MPAPATPADRRTASPARAAGARLVVVVAAVLATGACDVAPRGPRPAPAQDELASERPAPPEPPPTRVYAVQLGSYGDSVAAERVGRMLVDSGWTPSVHEAPVGPSRFWRVYVAATPGDSTFPELMASGVRVTGGEALAVRDTFAAAELVGLASVRAVRVTGGTPGTLARVRWALSPDGTAMVVVEDAAGVENALLPNGFVFASEALNCYVQGDSVWGVAPAPGWRQIALGRAAGVRAAAPPGDRAWRALAARTGIPADSARRGSFAASRTSDARALAQPVILELADDAGEEGTPALRRRAVPMAGGWELAWLADGRTLAVGTNPVGAEDDERSAGWIGVPESGAPALLDAVATSQLARPAWVNGPTLDPTLPVDLLRPGDGADGKTITNVGGWIRAADGTGKLRMVGPGVALAATRGGRFVLALAPHPDARREAPIGRLVVYAAAVWGRSAPAPCAVTDAPG
ncbi:MAG TPA: hypothetical protein VNA89_10500 [Gemmatimonadaceae bacterium]|nr:hypothetical protein [Gemmatimonadaceae bacterium]